jgi:hypothetical protein
MRTHFVTGQPFLPGNGVTGGSLIGVTIGFLLASCCCFGNCYYQCNK